MRKSRLSIVLAFAAAWSTMPNAACSQNVAAFGDETIRAAVSRGRFSHPRAAEYLARVPIERRDKFVRRRLGDAGIAPRATTP
jgi:hypothetical protein